MTSSDSRIARLVFDAAIEVLSGTVGQAPPFRMVAYSGGSRGHRPHVKGELAREYLHGQAGTLSSHLATTQEIRDANGRYKQRGGTLPPGHYSCQYLVHHHTFGECIRLLRKVDARA